MDSNKSAQEVPLSQSDVVNYSIMLSDAHGEEGETQEHLELMNLLSQFEDDPETDTFPVPSSSDTSLNIVPQPSVNDSLQETNTSPHQQSANKYPHLQSQISQDWCSVVPVEGNPLFGVTEQENFSFDPQYFESANNHESLDIFQPVEDSIEWAQHFGHSPQKNSTTETKASEVTKKGNYKKKTGKLKESLLPHWAKLYMNMFQCQSASFKQEKRFNSDHSVKPPHCSICALFVQSAQPTPTETSTAKSSNAQVPPWMTDDNSESSNDEPKTENTMADSTSTPIPAKSVPLSLESYKQRVGASLSTNDSESVLLKCTSCRVCVHAFCYGQKEDQKNKWKCDRCSRGKTEVVCCLCNLKGGALKLTRTNVWCHVVCALANQDIKFAENSLAESSISLDSISTSRKKLKCAYCRNFHSQAQTPGGIVTCTAPRKCRTPMHVTCGLAAGVSFQWWYTGFYITCHKHGGQKVVQSQPRPQKRDARELTKLEIGDKAIAKHKNGRYYCGTVINVIEDWMCEILFDDGSFSRNVYAEYIQNYNIRKDGKPPELDSKVKAYWPPDKQYYDGVFKGMYTEHVYEIMFEDLSKLHKSREEIFTLSEQLPQKVKLKLSEATPTDQDMDVTFSMWNTLGLSGKRNRQQNKLFFGNSFSPK